MLSLEERIKISMRRGSAIPITHNPLESIQSSSSQEDIAVKVASINEAREITPVEAYGLIAKLRAEARFVIRYCIFLTSIFDLFLTFSLQRP